MHEDVKTFFATNEFVVPPPIAPVVPSFFHEFQDRFNGTEVDRIDEMDERLVVAFSQWVRFRSGVPNLKLHMFIPHEEMYQEGLKLYPYAIKHRGKHHQGWQSITLHGTAFDHTDHHGKYGFTDRATAPYHWTIAALSAPISTAWWKDYFPISVFDRVRFMYLEPGGYILPHTDSKTPGLGAFNVALNHPDGCDMVTTKGRVPWAPGDVRMFDTSNEHCVWNRTDELRIHMIAHEHDHGDRYQAFSQLVVNSYLREYLK